MSDITKRNFMWIGLGAVAVAAGAGFAMNSTGSAPGYEHRAMTVDEMKAGDALIVDIRTPAEWRETGVIEGAKLVTFTDPASFLARLGPELADGRDLILVCRSGNRTQAAAKALQGKIENRIVSVAGGMKQIIAGGYRTVRPN